MGRIMHVAVAVASAVALLSLGGLKARADNPGTDVLNTFAKDMAALDGSTVYLQSTPGYRSAVQLFLALFNNRTPMLVLKAKSEKAVQQAVQFAIQHNIKVSVRSGGNSNLGWGTCDGCLSIDVKDLTSVSVDVDKLQATVGPGVTNRMLVDQVAPQGLAIPQGDCPMVCMGGYAVGGGLALTTRTLGFNIDALISMRVVGADGEIYVASETSHPDLFWGLRGGSGINLGIVTQLTYQAKKMPGTIIGGHISYEMTPSNAANVAGKMYDYIWGAGDPVSSRPWGFSLGWVPASNFASTEFRLMGLWFSQNQEQLAEGQRLLTEFKALPGFKEDQMITGTFKDVMQPLMNQYNGFGGLNWTMPDAMIKPPTSKADFISLITTVTVAARQQPDGMKSGLLAWVFAPMGGAANELPIDHTAFPHRRSGGNLHMPTIWNAGYDVEMRNFGQDSLYLTRQWWVPSVNKSSGDPESYVNHPSEYLNDYKSAYWGSNLARLQQVKRKYDPTNFLSNGQGIIATPTASSSSSPSPGSAPLAGLSGGAVAGIVLACIIAAVFIGAGIVYLRKQSHKEDGEEGHNFRPVL